MNKNLNRVDYESLKDLLDYFKLANYKLKGNFTYVIYRREKSINKILVNIYLNSKNKITF